MIADFVFMFTTSELVPHKQIVLCRHSKGMLLKNAAEHFTTNTAFALGINLCKCTSEQFPSIIDREDTRLCETFTP